MTNKAKTIPEGYHSVTPYMTVRDGVSAIDFYRRASGAELVVKLDMPDGKIAHAEMRIGDSIIMMSEENEDLSQEEVQRRMEAEFAH